MQLTARQLGWLQGSDENDTERDFTSSTDSFIVEIVISKCFSCTHTHTSSLPLFPSFSTCTLHSSSLIHSTNSHNLSLNITDMQTAHAGFTNGFGDNPIPFGKFANIQFHDVSQLQFDDSAIRKPPTSTDAACLAPPYHFIPFNDSNQRSQLQRQYWSTEWEDYWWQGTRTTDFEGKAFLFFRLFPDLECCHRG